MSGLRAFLAFLLLTGGLMAQPVTLSLVPSADGTDPAGRAWIDLIALNRSTSGQSASLPTALVAELTAGGRTWRVELRAVEELALENEPIAPGAFVAQTYRFDVPAGAAGMAIVEAQVGGSPPLRAVLDLRAGTRRADADAAEGREHPPRDTERVEKPTTNLTRAEPAASIIQRTFANRLAPHEPIYFIYGPDAPAAKFQFSFKYKLLQFTNVDEARMARTLQFAFTQRSLWDLEGDSSPFYDTSYIPELIYESLAPQPEEKDTWFTWLGYQAGFRHESNGRDGPVSRSLNVVYARPVFAFGALDGWHLLVIPEVFTYVDTLEDNPDLKDYRGHGMLRLVFGRNDGPSLMVSAWAGRDFDHGTVQLDFTLPLRTRLLDFETYLLVQYFNGYGESLLSYRESSETVRAGFSLVR